MTNSTQFGPLQWAIIGLTLITAAIHIWFASLWSDTIFYLNGFGYLGLLGLLYLPIAFLKPYRNLVRWVLIAYTAVTFFAWLFIGLGSPLAGPVDLGDTKTIVAYISKISELALIVCLWLEGRRSRST